MGLIKILNECYYQHYRLQPHDDPNQFIMAKIAHTVDSDSLFDALAALGCTQVLVDMIGQKVSFESERLLDILNIRHYCSLHLLTPFPC